MLLDGEQRLSRILVKLESGDIRFLPVESFEVGKESVLIKGVDCLKNAGGGDDHGMYQSCLGHLVIEENGREIGVVSNIIVPAAGERIEGIEISGGLIKDLIDGRIQVPVDQIKTLEDQRLVITDQGGID